MKFLIEGPFVALSAPLGWIGWRTATRLCGEARPPNLGPMMAAAVLIVASAMAVTPAPGAFVAGVALGWGLVTLAAVDVAALRLPDVVTLPLIVAGLAAALANVRSERPGLSSGLLLDHTIGAAAGYAAFAGLTVAYRRLRGRDGLGLGDAKLAACAGAWLGWAALPEVVLIACAVTFAWVGWRLVRHDRRLLDQPIPFGAPLALAIWIIWLVPVGLGTDLG